MKEIFDDYVRNAFGSEVQAEFKFKQFEYNYRGYFPTNRAARVIDIGIGRGEMLACMRDWEYENYIGIDISPATIKFCASIGLKCKYVDSTERYLLEHASQFDVITLLDVLEHVKKDSVVAFLQALRTALKPGGVLIIQVPNSQAPDGQLHRYNDITHEVGYIEHSLAQVLLAASFVNFHFKGFEAFVSRRPIEVVRRFCRMIHWGFVRLLRMVDGNLNPKILHPVFFAVVFRDDPAGSAVSVGDDRAV